MTEAAAAMSWPEVVRWLSLAVGVAATLAGLAWTLGRMFRPWMRNAAREAADEVRAEVKALSDKLATNDFPHIEAKIEREASEAKTERAAMETRIGGRLDRVSGRLDRMETRATEGRREILDAIRRLGEREQGG